jgi:hypothetical protein
LEVRAIADIARSSAARPAGQRCGLEADIVVNIQNDQPFLDAGMIAEGCNRWRILGPMATLCTRSSGRDDLSDPSVVKVVSRSGRQRALFLRVACRIRGSRSHSVFGTPALTCIAGSFCSALGVAAAHVCWADQNRWSKLRVLDTASAFAS